MCVCVCVLLSKSLLQLQGMKTRDKWIPCLQENTLEAQENFVVYEEHVKPIKSELSSCCSSFCRSQSLVGSPAASPPSAQVCVCAGKVQGHTCSELTCTQRLTLHTWIQCLHCLACIQCETGLPLSDKTPHPFYCTSSSGDGGEKCTLSASFILRMQET